MKQLRIGAVAFAAMITVACQGNKQQEEAQKLSEKAIAVHDEIMPEISVFNKHDIFVDSLLQNLEALKATNAELDTAVTREKLETLKTNLESANDKMMDWMNGYSLDSTDVAYQQAELDRISALKETFDQVKYEAESLLTTFKK